MLAVERRIGRERLLHRGVRDAARVELPLDVRGEAHPPHPLHVTRPRAVAEPIERVKDALVGAERRGGQAEGGPGRARPARAAGPAGGAAVRAGAEEHATPISPTRIKPVPRRTRRIATP